MKSFATEMHAVIQLLAQFLSNEILVLGGLTHVISKGVQRRQGKARQKKKKKKSQNSLLFQIPIFANFCRNTTNAKVSSEIPQLL